MSGRRLATERLTNNTRGVDYYITILGTGAATPTLLEGDTNGATTGTYVTLARSGVGNLTITTNDPFPAVLSQWYQVAPTALTANSLYNANPITPTQNANNTWTFTLALTTTSSAGATSARDLAVGDILYVGFSFRNGTNNP